MELIVERSSEVRMYTFWVRFNESPPIKFVRNYEERWIMYTISGANYVTDTDLIFKLEKFYIEEYT